MLYSNCGQDDWAERRRDILKYCLKRTRLGLVAPRDDAHREEIRGKVKYLWFWNSWFEVMSKCEQNWVKEKDSELKETNRLKLHSSKRNNLTVYKNWRMIHTERE